MREMIADQALGPLHLHKTCVWHGELATSALGGDVGVDTRGSLELDSQPVEPK